MQRMSYTFFKYHPTADISTFCSATSLSTVQGCSSRRRPHICSILAAVSDWCDSSFQNTFLTGCLSRVFFPTDSSDPTIRFFDNLKSRSLCLTPGVLFHHHVGERRQFVPRLRKEIVFLEEVIIFTWCFLGFVIYFCFRWQRQDFLNKLECSVLVVIKPCALCESTKKNEL